MVQAVGQAVKRISLKREGKGLKEERSETLERGPFDFGLF